MVIWRRKEERKDGGKGRRNKKFKKNRSNDVGRKESSKCSQNWRVGEKEDRKKERNMR